MKRTIMSVVIGSLFLFAAGPAAPVQNMYEADQLHNEQVAAAKKVYDAEVARADQERLNNLQDLLDRAKQSQDIPLANGIQRRIDQLKKAATAEVKFFDVKDTGKKVVYLCDASGSMLSVFGVFKQRLKESVNKLDAGTEFNVIIFSDENVFPLFKDGPLPANDDTRKKAMDFIDNAVSTGGTQPLPAIKFALAEHPDLIYLLTDGFDQISNFDEVTKAFKDGNPDGKTKVDCIFLESDPDPKLEECLKKLAHDTKGTFAKIEKSDM
jgi:hypothetical protein